MNNAAPGEKVRVRPADGRVVTGTAQAGGAVALSSRRLRAERRRPRADAERERFHALIALVPRHRAEENGSESPVWELRHENRKLARADCSPPQRRPAHAAPRTPAPRSRRQRERSSSPSLSSSLAKAEASIAQTPVNDDARRRGDQAGDANGESRIDAGRIADGRIDSVREMLAGQRWNVSPRMNCPVVLPSADRQRLALLIEAEAIQLGEFVELARARRRC